MGSLSRYLYQHPKWTDPDLHPRLDLTRNYASHKIKSRQGRGVPRYPFADSRITTLFALIAALLCLFIVLPVAKTLGDDGVAMRILGNTRINATGQAVEVSRREFLEELIVVRFAPEGR